MGVDDVVAVVAVPGQVDLLHAVCGQGVQVVQRVEAVVHAAHIDVVHVHQQQAVGLVGDVAQKLPFAGAVFAVTDVARHVLDHQAAAQHVLRAVDLRHHMARAGVGVGQGVEVV